jgi:hypothetical protein
MVDFNINGALDLTILAFYLAVKQLFTIFAAILKKVCVSF